MIAVKVFAEGVTQQINKYLPEKYQNVECHVIEQQKNNGTMKAGLRLDIPGQNIAPIVYMEPFYDLIRQGEPMEQVMRQIAETCRQALEVQALPEQMDLTDYDSIKEYLSVQIINTKANQRMLAGLPHKKMEDLSVICRIEFPFSDEGGAGSIKVTHEMLNQWGVRPEEVYQKAVENAVKNQPPVLMSMSDLMMDVMELPFEADNLLELKEGCTFPKDKIYALTNERKLNGASVLAYPELPKQLEAVFPQGCYLLPSSLHELMVVPKDDLTLQPKELGEMVREINQTNVPKDEILSDRVYEFDKETKKLRQVPESIEKAKEMER